MTMHEVLLPIWWSVVWGAVTVFVIAGVVVAAVYLAHRLRRH